MTLFATYSSPTTPGAAAWQEDVTSAIRLGSITGLSGEARLGATGIGGVTLDDPASDIGHVSDGIVGLKQFHLTETACPVGNQRLWTGYVGPRTYRRGQGNSLITEAAREIEVTLVDLNDFLSFRVFAPTADDPTSDFVRPAETHIARVQALLTEVDFLSTTLFDVGYIPATGGVNMDAHDYTGQRPIDVLNDCAQVSGWNFWVKYHEATNQFVLWFDDPGTDGTATLVYDSALRLTNVLSEVDGTTTFAAINAELTYDPSRLISAAWLPGTGVTGYGTAPTTAYTYAWRDAVMPSAFVKSQAVADALVARYLADNSTEDPTIRCSVQLPNQYVTEIHEGMRLQVHFTHLPLVNSGFFWTRVLSRNIRVDVETQEYYWLDLELSPIPLVAVPSFYTSTNSGGCEVGTWPEGSPPEGALLVGFLSQRDISTSDATIVPIGNGVSPGSETCDAVLDIAGTEWTFIDNLQINDGAGHLGQLTLAYRMAAASEPQTIRWGGAGGLNGSARPRSHQVAFTDLTGAPTVTNKGTISMGATMTTVSVVATGAGRVIAGINYRCTGPADGSSASFTLSAVAPAVDLTQGFQYSSFGGYSWFGYLDVAGAGTYDISVTRSAAPRSSYVAGSIVGFWPE